MHDATFVNVISIFNIERILPGVTDSFLKDDILLLVRSMHDNLPSKSVTEDLKLKCDTCMDLRPRPEISKAQKRAVFLLHKPLKYCRFNNKMSPRVTRAKF